jgi:hypothetical protein
VVQRQEMTATQCVDAIAKRAPLVALDCNTMHLSRPTTMQSQSLLEFDFFRVTFEVFEQMLGWLQSKTGVSSYAEMVRALRKRGFELMRVMYQAWLDLRSMFEKREQAVAMTDADIAVRSRGRNIECDFGSVRLNRLGYTRPGQTTVFPLDRELNLPDEVFSLEVRQRVAFESQRSSWDETVATIARNSSAHVPKRQAQELTQRVAQDVDAFYQRIATITPSREGAKRWEAVVGGVTHHGDVDASRPRGTCLRMDAAVS